MRCSKGLDLCLQADRGAYVCPGPRQKTGGGSGANLAASVREILSEVDKDNDGRIDYQEFCDMMRGQVGLPHQTLVEGLGPLIQGNKTCMKPAHSVCDWPVMLCPWRSFCSH